MKDRIKKIIKWINTIFGLYKIQKDRVESQIKEFELNSSGNSTINAILDEIKTLAENGEFDKAWQYLHQIDFLKVDSASDEWLAARAISLKEESAKFDDKRKKAVAELLKTPSQENIKEAILTRNKFYDTHYHKIAIRTKNLGILIVLLLLAIVFIFVESSIYNCPLETARLVRSATYGLLGAVLSMALTLTSKPLDEKIPDLVIGIRVTWLRPIIGIAAGIVSLMVVDTDVLKTLFSAELVKNVTIIAFIAGFSERFIVSIVDILAKKS